MSVETRAVIHGANHDTTLRRDDVDDKPRVWIQTKLDGDGEFALTIEDLGQGLKILGINRADLFPDG